MDAHPSGPGLSANARKRRYTDTSFDESDHHHYHNPGERPRKIPRAISQSYTLPPPDFYTPTNAYSDPLHQFPVFFPATQPLTAAEPFPPLAFDPSVSSHETLWTSTFQPAPMPVTSPLMGSPLGVIAPTHYEPQRDTGVELNAPLHFHSTTFPTADLTESEADDFHPRPGSLSRSASAARESKQHYDSLAMGYMNASKSATPALRDTGTPSSLPGPPAHYHQSRSPPYLEPRPSLPPSVTSIDTTPHGYSPSPNRATESRQTTATPSKGLNCHHCNEPCKGPKALKRHVWEQHEMDWCHFCPICSCLVVFEPHSEEDSHERLGLDPLKVLRCSHCDDDETCLAPQDIVSHFRRYHYHSLSSTRMLFIKRPDDVSRHFEAKKRRKDDGHRWLHEHTELAKEFFKVEDDQHDTVRGCDRGCDDCGGSLEGLAEFVKHCSDTRKDGLPQAQKDDTAFSTQVRSLLSSERVRAAWTDCLDRRGEPAKLKWRYNGEAPSQLLADLEAAATFGLEPKSKLVERAYEMIHGNDNGSR